MKSICIMLALTLVLSALIVNAQTFYVATNGNDATSRGTLKKPWATISYAIGQVNDGATIEVAPGLYQGKVRLDQRFANGIVIR